MSRSSSCLAFFALFALFALVPTMACSAPDASAPVAEVIDSAGVRLVLNHLPEGPVGTGGLSLDAEPMLEIGTFEGDSLYQLYRVAGARRLADGRIVVANAGSGEVRVYGADGRYQRTWGREGGGPGEFLDMTLVGAMGSDTLVVLDNQNRRISFIHPDDGFLGSVPVDEEVVGFPVAHGLFDDGALVVGGGPPRIVPGDLRNGTRRFPANFRSYQRDGSLATDFGEYPGYELFMWVREGGGTGSMGASLLPFPRTTVAAVAADLLYLGTQDSYEIRAYDPSGSLRSIIRLDQELRPLTSSDVAAYLEAQLENIDDPGRQARRRREIEGMSIGETMPAYGGMTADAIGHLWVLEYGSPQDAAPVYTVFDPEGKLVGRLPMPDRFTVIEIGSDYVLGRYTDELDVEYVRLYRLSREG